MAGHGHGEMPPVGKTREKREKREKRVTKCCSLPSSPRWEAPLALDIWEGSAQSHKELISPSLSTELGSEKVAGEADAIGDGKEEKTQPPWVLPALTFVPHCHPALPELPGWILCAPVVTGTGQGDGSTGREQGKAEDPAFPSGMCWAGFGHQPELVMSKPWGCDNSSSLGFQVPAWVGQ